MALTQQEEKHYDRHLILEDIGLNGQLKIKNTKVLVVGAGGLGCPVLQYLTAAGVGTIGIIDGDKVALSNLQRQILFSLDDVGKYKAEQAVLKLSKLNPHVNFKNYITFLTPKNALEIFNDYDIIVDGSDNFQTRYLSNDAAVITNKPLVFGSIFKFKGQVTVFNYKKGPTYRCLYSTPPEPNAVPNCSEVGVLGVLPGIVGTLMANEVLKIILDFNYVLSGKLLMVNAKEVSFQSINFNKTDGANVKVLQADYECFCGLNSTFKIENLNLDDIKNLNEDILFLDVKTKKEHQKESIPSINIPLDKILELSVALPRDKTIVLFCKTGFRSKQAIAKLRSLGFKNRLIALNQS